MSGARKIAGLRIRFFLHNDLGFISLDDVKIQNAPSKSPRKAALDLCFSSTVVVKSAAHSRDMIILGYLLLNLG